MLYKQIYIKHDWETISHHISKHWQESGGYDAQLKLIKDKTKIMEIGMRW